MARSDRAAGASGSRRRTRRAWRRGRRAPCTRGCSTAATASSIRYRYTETPRSSAAGQADARCRGWRARGRGEHQSELPSGERPCRRQRSIARRRRSMSRRVYLDHNASTPVHPEVAGRDAAVLLRAVRQPLERPRLRPRGARGARRRARADRAFLRVGKEEIVFTSGGTESDNLAVKGVAAARGRATSSPRASSTTRCSAPARRSSTRASTVTYLPVDGHGLVDPDDVRRAIRPDTILVIDHARELRGRHRPAGRGDRARSRASTRFPSTSTPFRRSASSRSTSTRSASTSCRSPATRSTGPRAWPGSTCARARKMVSVQHGGEHERRRRAGTENVAGIVGSARRSRSARRDMAERGGAAHRPPRPPLGGGQRPRARGAGERSPHRSGCPARATCPSAVWSPNRSCSGSI